jgi:acyl carrier protein
MTDFAEIEAEIKRYIQEEFVEEQDSDLLDESTQLLTSGVLDSIATLQLVGHLEDKFDISLAAHEVNVRHFNSLATIARLVQAKL